MGKSPGKWIKSLLFGKKSSKSNLSKEVTGERRSATMASPMEDLAPNPPIQNFKRESENTEQEKMTSTGIMCDSADLSSVAQHIESQVTKGAISPDNAKLKRQEQAAIKAQAAFRGYLARRAFLTLKVIIRLQALIRGHLVRRQAVATLRCMQAIVRVQALARGQKARLLDPAYQVLKKYFCGELKVRAVIWGTSGALRILLVSTGRSGFFAVSFLLMAIFCIQTLALYISVMYLYGHSDFVYYYDY